MMPDPRTAALPTGSPMASRTARAEEPQDKVIPPPPWPVIVNNGLAVHFFPADNKPGRSIGSVADDDADNPVAGDSRCDKRLAGQRPVIAG